MSAVLSLVLGTLLVAMRVGPDQRAQQGGAVYVTVVRNTPLVIIFLFFQLGAGKIFDALRFSWVDIHIGQFDFTSFFTAAVVSLTPLHLGLRLRGAALRRQRRAPRPGRGGAGHRTALQRA